MADSPMQMMMRLACRSLLLAATLLVATDAGAGVRASTSSSDSASKGQDVTTELAMDGHRLRMDVNDASGQQPPMTMLFDGSKSELILINHGDKSLTRLDDKTGQAIRARMEAARRQMAERLKQLPPEQREMAEKMLSGHLGMAGLDDPKARPTPAPVKVTATGRTESVGGRSCRVFRVRRADAEPAEICAESWADAGVTEKDLLALEQLGEFQTRMVEEVGGQGMPAMHHPFDLFRQVQGIPLRTRQKDGEGGVRETTFTEIRKADVPESTFDIPAGYSERQLLPPMPQG